MKILQAKTILQKIRIYNLYISAFPKCERKPFSVILSMQKKGKTDVWYIEKDGRFVAMAATINGNNLILLDYFAVSKKCRGQGLGTEILKALRSLYPDKGFFLEIEQASDPEDTEKVRRKSFYLSAGMKELGVCAKLFGVDMELLGQDCVVTFDGYREFYRTNYGEFAAKNIGHITSL